MSGPILELVDGTVRYGGVAANVGVSLSVAEGELVGLIGPNGAGKSTCIDAISGFVGLDEGSVRLQGNDVSHLDAPERKRLGLSRTFQSLDLFEDLSVTNNLSVATETTGLRTLLADALRPWRHQSLSPVVGETLQRCGIAHLAERRPRELSHGQRNLVALARALAGGPDVVLLDEPAAGLDTTESANLGRLLTSLTGDGLGILLVDHDMSLMMKVCDRVYVLDFGQIIASGTPAEVRANPRVRAAYLGEPEDGEPAELSTESAAEPEFLVRGGDR